MGNSSQMYNNTLLTEIDDIYTALSYSLYLSRDDPEWRAVNERISELVNKIEQIYTTFNSTGVTLPRKLRLLVKDLARNVKKRDLYLTGMTLRKLEELVEKTYSLSKGANRFIINGRFLLSVSFATLTTVLLYSTQSTIEILMLIVVLGLLLSSLLLLKTRFYMYVVSAAFLVEASVLLFARYGEGYGILYDGVLVLLVLLFLVGQVESIMIAKDLRETVDGITE
ncbi:MAG: hypothetical protein GSR77_05530 [Desulfurococcales archaeon]|nr:hypothetical protein [Desulfurococcales archaeon]